jgi:hypothetical protein
MQKDNCALAIALRQKKMLENYAFYELCFIKKWHYVIFYKLYFI